MHCWKELYDAANDHSLGQVQELSPHIVKQSHQRHHTSTVLPKQV